MTVPRLLLPVLSLAAACARSVPAPTTTRLHVVSTDYAFAVPDSLPAGPTRFRFRRDGTAAHEVAIARVKRGVPVDSLLRLELAGAPIDGLYDPGEGLLYAGVGETIDAELLVTLEAGRDYVLICTLEEKGRPHSTLGMVRRIRVFAAPGGGD